VRPRSACRFGWVSALARIGEDFFHSIASNIRWLYCSRSAAAKLSLAARIA